MKFEIQYFFRDYTGLDSDYDWFYFESEKTPTKKEIREAFAKYFNGVVKKRTVYAGSGDKLIIDFDSLSQVES